MKSSVSPKPQTGSQETSCPPTYILTRYHLGTFYNGEAKYQKHVETCHRCQFKLTQFALAESSPNGSESISPLESMDICQLYSHQTLSLDTTQRLENLLFSSGPHLRNFLQFARFCRDVEKNKNLLTDDDIAGITVDIDIPSEDGTSSIQEETVFTYPNIESIVIAEPLDISAISTDNRNKSYNRNQSTLSWWQASSVMVASILLFVIFSIWLTQQLQVRNSPKHQSLPSSVFSHTMQNSPQPRPISIPSPHRSDATDAKQKERQTVLLAVQQVKPPKNDNRNVMSSPKHLGRLPSSAPSSEKKEIGDTLKCFWSGILVNQVTSVSQWESSPTQTNLYKRAEHFIRQCTDDNTSILAFLSLSSTHSKCQSHCQAYHLGTRLFTTYLNVLRATSQSSDYCARLKDFVAVYNKIIEDGNSFMEKDDHPSLHELADKIKTCSPPTTRPATSNLRK